MKYLLLLSLIAAAIPALAANEGAYFPSSYEDAVARIQKLVTTQQIPIDSAKGEKLQIDYFFKPASKIPQNLLILSSGVHGAEAFAGSAVQQMFLSEKLSKVNAETTGVLIIHGINPWGFKHFRRVDENNVDLNRNFPAAGLYTMKNPGYDKLEKLLAPAEPVGIPLFQRLGNTFELGTGLKVTGEYKLKELSDAIGQGQHTSPRGLEYGGIKPAQQVGIIRDLIQRTSQPYKRVVFIDIHTGLGSANQLHMMTGDGVAFSRSPFLKQLLKPEVDGDHYDLASGDDEGFYPTPGDIINYVPTILRANQEVVSVTAEFGTIGTGTFNLLKSLNRLILENQGYHYGYKYPFIQSGVEDDFHEFFLPSSPEWRRLVIEKSRYLFDRLLERL